MLVALIVVGVGEGGGRRACLDALTCGHASVWYSVARPNAFNLIEPSMITPPPNFGPFLYFCTCSLCELHCLCPSLCTSAPPPLLPSLPPTATSGQGCVFVCVLWLVP
jgi:hypothetical protein